MHLIGKLVAGAALTTLTVIAARAQETPAFGSSSADAARIRAMDLAGVRLGMTPAQARAALKASGYVPTPNREMWTDGRPKVQRSYDYSSRVEQERKIRLSDGSPMRPAETIVGEDWNKGDETVHVAYVPMRDAVVVTDVQYGIPVGRIGWEAIRSSVVSRYGRPTRLSDTSHRVRYCGDGGCSPLGEGYVELGLSEGWRIELNDGGAYDRLSRRQIVADADASIRKTGRPSF